jgi:hypothetical protein
MPSGWRVVLQIDVPKRGECLRFADLPVVDPAHLAIVAEEPAAVADAARLFARLAALLSSLSPASSRPEACDGPRLLECMARGEPSCQSLLVVVCGANPISGSLAQRMRAWQARPQRRSSLLPILPKNAPVDSTLPGIDKYLALFLTGPIETLAPDVLRTAGIGGPDHRLFVSYRREDTQDLAEQLADAFDHAGFQVFLDRFSGTLGRPFPRILAEELADKGMLLVLESPLVRKSRWTLREVAFARLLHLGLFALALPHGPAFQEIRGGDRHVPAAGDWTAPGPRGPKLTDAGCASVVGFVRERYAVQALTRQLYLENLLHQVLAARGLGAEALGGTTFRVRAGADYLVQLSSRPPRLAELRRASSAAQPLAAHPVIVGAHRLLPPEDRSDIEWLAGELQASLRQEGRLPRLAAAFAAGQVPP